MTVHDGDARLIDEGMGEAALLLGDFVSPIGPPMQQPGHPFERNRRRIGLGQEQLDMLQQILPHDVDVIEDLREIAELGTDFVDFLHDREARGFLVERADGIAALLLKPRNRAQTVLHLLLDFRDGFPSGPPALFRPSAEGIGDRRPRPSPWEPR
jgi:hypothetical protein